MTGDRVGLGWRPALAAGILSRLDRIDVLEVVAEEWFRSSSRELRALRSLARERPTWIHGVSLGLASTVPVERKRLDAIARLVAAVEPEGWSEHLAFVRGGGVEIGHLAAPPRNAATIEGTLANAERARRVVGSPPALENVATLIDPPGSDRDEAAWTAAIVRGTEGGLLLDLHNLHANARNFGFSPEKLLREVPVERIRVVHLAGGRQEQRLVDDHLHPVPDVVFDLLGHVARRARGPLTVILERDGAFPPVADLVAEVERARRVLAEARSPRDLARV